MRIPHAAIKASDAETQMQACEEKGKHKAEAPEDRGAAGSTQDNDAGGNGEINECTGAGAFSATGRAAE